MSFKYQNTRLGSRKKKKRSGIGVKTLACNSLLPHSWKKHFLVWNHTHVKEYKNQQHQEDAGDDSCVCDVLTPTQRTTPVPLKACQNPKEPLPWVKWTSTTNLQWNPATSCSRWPHLRARGAASSARARMKLIRVSTLKLFQPLKLNSAWISRRRFLPPPHVFLRDLSHGGCCVRRYIWPPCVRWQCVASSLRAPLDVTLEVVLLVWTSEWITFKTTGVSAGVWLAASKWN